MIIYSYEIHNNTGKDFIPLWGRLEGLPYKFSFWNRVSPQESCPTGCHLLTLTLKECILFDLLFTVDEGLDSVKRNIDLWIYML